MDPFDWISCFRLYYNVCFSTTDNKHSSVSQGLARKARFRFFLRLWHFVFRIFLDIPHCPLSLCSSFANFSQVSAYVLLFPASWRTEVDLLICRSTHHESAFHTFKVAKVKTRMWANLWERRGYNSHPLRCQQEKKEPLVTFHCSQPLGRSTICLRCPCNKNQALNITNRLSSSTLIYTI